MLPAPTSKVALCEVPASVLVHVTVAPGATMMARGLKVELTMLTEVVATGVVVPPPPPPPGPVLSELPPQARMAAARGTNIRRVCIGTPCSVADLEVWELAATIEDEPHRLGFL